MGGLLCAPISSKFVERAGNKYVRAACSSVQGFREDMEDAYTVEFDMSKKHPDIMMFAVYDGHGGAQASAYLKQHFPSMIAELDDPFDEAQLRRAVMKLDDNFLETPDRAHGSTACFVIARPSQQEGAPEGSLELKVCNVGDSRALMVRKDGTWQALTEDHKPDNEFERQRIQNAHGYVANARVDGNLAVSRAVGDYIYKNQDLAMDKQKVIAVPDFRTVMVEKDDVILLCCDGIYEQMTWSEVATVVHAEMFGTDEHKVSSDQVDLAEVANKIIKTSIDKGSKDNHTAVLLHLGDGTNYTSTYKAKEFYPGPYHAHAGNAAFADAYKKDLEANGYDFNEVVEEIKTYERENGMPTEISHASKSQQSEFAMLQSFFGRGAYSVDDDE